MGLILENPVVSRQQNLGAPVLYYLADGAAVFGCIGNPEGLIWSNKRSLALSDNGSVYFKTTDNADTGWVVLGGGGGSGTVTSVGLLMPSIFSVAGSPVTTSGTFNVTLASQAANVVFASPNGAAGTPLFRKLVPADINSLAPGVLGAVPYNDGTGQFTATNDFRFDTAAGVLLLGEVGVRKGNLDLTAVGGGRVRFTVDAPSAAPITYTMPNGVAVTNDLLRAANVVGNTITLGFVAPSALGLANLNPTTDFLPYNNGTAYADSPIRRLAAGIFGFGNAASDAAFRNDTSYSSVGLSLVRGNANTTQIDLAVSALHLSSVLGSTTTRTIALSNGSGGTIIGCNALQIGWSNNVNGAGVGGLTVALTWLASGVARVSNGSTGAGQLAVGTSTATTSHQFLVDSQAAARIAIFATVQGGASQPAIECQQSGSLIFRAGQTGKVQGAANLVQIFSVLGNAKSDVSTIGNVGTGTDNLLSFAVIGNSLNNTGDYVEFDAFGEFANNANDKTLAITFGGTTIFTTGALPFGTAALANWRINAKILRTGASAQKCIVTFWSNDGTTKFLQTITTSGIDLTVNQTVQFTGTATANDDILQLHMESKIVVAQTS